MTQSVKGLTWPDPEQWDITTINIIAYVKRDCFLIFHNRIQSQGQS